MEILLYYDQSLHHPSLKLNDIANNHVKILGQNDLDLLYYCNHYYDMNSNRLAYLYSLTNDKIGKLLLYVCLLKEIRLCYDQTKHRSN